MEVQRRNWDNLPFEVLYKIFSQVQLQHLHVLNLVCKSWHDPAQARLYYSVQPRTLSQLKKFHTTVKEFPRLGEKVKELFLLIVIPDEVTGRSRAMMGAEIDNIMTDLLYSRLPYLESCKDACLDSHIPIIDALIDSRLPRLKDIDEPIHDINDREAVTNYVTCALLLKDRLEHLSMADDFSVFGELSSEKFYYQRLYSKHHLFKRLKSINISRTTSNVIDLMEDIVENHQYLQEICMNVNTPYSSMDNITIPMDIKSTFTPRSNIKRIINHAQSTYDEKTLLYIMHKFPELCEFISKVNNRRFYRKVSQQTLVQFLHYLFKIKKFDITGLAVDVDTIAETLEEIWETTSSIGNEDVDISFGSVFGESATLEVSRLKNSIKTKVCFNVNHNIKSLDFIKRNGKYIKSITISQTEGGVVPDEVIDHIFTYCPHLQNIHLNGLTILYPSISGERKCLSLNELSVEKCAMGDQALEPVSYRIAKIKQVRFINCTEAYYQDSDDEDLDSEEEEEGCILKEVDLQYTEVDSVLMQADFGPSSCYARLSNSSGSDSGWGYYRFSTDGKREDISKEEYEKIDDESNCIFDICCLNTSDLTIKC